MPERFCTQCRKWFEAAGRQTTCSPECREERIAERQRGIGSKMTILRRVLESEKIYPRDDRLAYSENFYAALQEWPCIWCGSEEKGTGINLDRVDNSQPHFSNNVAPVCSNMCNKIRSDILSFEEMKILRDRLVDIRIRRGNTNRN